MRLLILKLHANNFEIEATFLKLHHAPLPIIHLVKAGRMALVLLHKQSCCQVSISAVSNFVAFRLVVSPFPSPPLSCFSFLLPDPARPCTFPICILMTFGLTCKLLREVKDLGSMVLAGTRMCRGPVYLDPFSGSKFVAACRLTLTRPGGLVNVTATIPIPIPLPIGLIRIRTDIRIGSFTVKETSVRAEGREQWS